MCIFALIASFASDRYLSFMGSAYFLCFFKGSFYWLSLFFMLFQMLIVDRSHSSETIKVKKEVKCVCL